MQGLQELLSDRSVSNRWETNQLTRTYIYKTIHMMGQETSKVTYDPLFTNQMVIWQSPMDYVNSDKEHSSTHKHKTEKEKKIWQYQWKKLVGWIYYRKSFITIGV